MLYLHIQFTGATSHMRIVGCFSLDRRLLGETFMRKCVTLANDVVCSIRSSNGSTRTIGVVNRPPFRFLAKHK